MDMAFEPDAVVVVAGVPGAGKTTLIRRAVDRDRVLVLDTDDERAAGRGGHLLYPRHYARIAAAVLFGSGPVVVHSRGTRSAARRVIAALARLGGRPAHLLLLDADRPAAEAGQRARGRVLAAATMDREWSRWRRLRARGVDGEGWRTVHALSRPEAARIRRLVWKEAAPIPTMKQDTPLGTTGFDVVGSWGRLRVEVPEAS